MKGVYSDMLHVCRVIASRWSVYVLMILGLGLSYCAAIVIALHVHDELTYDRFIPGADKVYLLSAGYGPQGQPLVASDVAPAGMARWIRTDVPQVAAVARLVVVDWPMHSARRSVKERFYWADANVFDVLKLPALYGDPRSGLSSEGKVVLTARMARAYFGTDKAIGRILYTKGDIPLTVTAVLRDFPANTTLDREIFVSGAGSYAMLQILDSNPDLLWPTSHTYLRLRNGASPQAIQHRLFDVSRKHWQGPHNLPEGFELIPLFNLHLRPHGDGEMKPRGHLNTILALAAVAVAVLALAGINFSGLILAEMNERGSDMALRTALGATRADLVGDVLKEALLVNGISALLALAAVERLLPRLNRSLDLGLSLWAHPGVVVALLTAATMVVTLASALYPAMIVSRTAVSRDARTKAQAGIASSGRWFLWVVAQLALVIVLLIASHTLYRQWTYAIHGALRFSGDDVVMIKYSDNPEANAAFNRDVRVLPGVEAAAEAFGAPTNEYIRPGWIHKPGGGLISLTRDSVHPDFLRVFDIPLLAGHNLSGTFLSPEMPKDILVNMAAVKALGLSRAEDAIGKELVYDTDRTQMRSRIVGVVPDLRFSTLYEPSKPMIFDNFSKYFTQINVKLRPGNTAQTLGEIDALWRRDMAGSMPIDRRFFNAYLTQQYHDLHQQMRVFYVVSAVAILLSMLGLTGLSIFLTRHQVREMAVRRALGATTGDIFVERLTPFLKPLLITNLIGWPIAWLSLETWLKSFADHVPLSVISFVGAGAISVVFALATIAAHSALTARNAALSSSLRHE